MNPIVVSSAKGSSSQSICRHHSSHSCFQLALCIKALHRLNCALCCDFWTKFQNKDIQTCRWSLGATLLSVIHSCFRASAAVILVSSLLSKSFRRRSFTSVETYEIYKKTNVVILTGVPLWRPLDCVFAENYRSVEFGLSFTPWKICKIRKLE